MRERNRLNFKKVKAAAPGVKSPKKWIFFYKFGLPISAGIKFPEMRFYRGFPQYRPSNIIYMPFYQDVAAS